MRRLRLVLLCLTAAVASPSDVKQMTDGVGALIAPKCLPGPVAVYGDEAFAIVAAKAKGGSQALFAATRYGQGRLVAGGHEGFFNAAAMPSSDNQRFLLNLVRWLGQSQTPRVGLLGFAATRQTLTDAGCTVTELDPKQLAAQLAQVDVLLASAAFGSAPGGDDQVEAVASFVEQGGGALLTSCAWGWQQLHPDQDLRTELGGNRIANRMGLAWCDAYVDQRGADGWAVDGQHLDECHAGRALARLGEGKLDDQATAAAVAVIQNALQALPVDNPLAARIDALSGGSGQPPVATEEHPIKLSQPLERLGMVRWWQAVRQLKPHEIKAHPAAATFPGAVPADAPRVTRTVKIDTNVPAWHSTGLYAAAGEVVTITLPAGAAQSKLSVQFGAHKDRLWDNNPWKRCPEVTWRQRLAATSTEVASPFGGLVYLDVPSGCKLGTIAVAVAGVVEAPLFVLGQTSQTDWRERLRSLPGPWAELGTDKVILTVPSANVRNLDEPEALLKFWDRVLDADADLARIPRERDRPERYVTDVQISAGYMHSGYPIMTHLDAAPRFVDLERLQTKGDWGMFHEMGHNHQSGYWTFGGTTEVTCNLFSLYVLDKVCGLSKPEDKRVYNDRTTKTYRQYLADGSPFSAWQKEPFLALRMYVQLQEAFGWEAYQHVFAAYRDAPKEDLPKTDADERDQWMVRFSREVGRNLGPFFQKWGVPTSEQARASIADLPVWLPEELTEG